MLPNGEVLPALSIVYDSRDEAQTVTLTFAKALPVGAGARGATLRMAFDGTLNDKMAGFYRSAYSAPGGVTRHMGVTQFEATDARRAFPCWDEPALKATFDVTLRVPSDREALGNMPPVKTAPGPAGWKDVTFERTPLMSTYRVAWVVGEFDCVEDVTAEGVAVRVWTPPGLGEQGRFALKVGVHALSFFTRYFGAPYPLPKMDMVAVPDFAAGAMENWGLVTYRTVLALYDPETTGSAVKQQSAYVVCHELAHQWFGNLVTMGWWSHLWLNEGFATWAGWLAVDALFPEWRVWDQFLVNEQARGLELDGLESSHPIEVEIPDASKVNEIFDAISYAKGASAIHMLVAYMGEEAFQKGMRLYVSRHAWGNAATGDLWAALAESSGKPVGALMACWTQQTGYPVVHASRSGDELAVRQERFLSTGKAADATRWLVPLRVACSSAPGAAGNPAWDAMLSGAEGGAHLPAGAAWAKLNAGQAGFYRVAYDSGMASALAAAAPALPTADRCGLVGDAFALAAAGHAPTAAALALLASLGAHGEGEYVVWANAAAGLGAVQSTWFEQPARVSSGLETYARRLYAALAARTGWAPPAAGESHLDALLRSLAVGRAASLGDGDALAAARARFTSFTAGDAAALPPDLRAAVFKAVLARGGRAEFEALLGIYNGAEQQELRIAALQALGAAADPALVRRALEFNLHGGSVRSQDLMYVVASAAANAKGRRVAWDYLREQWDDIKARLDGGGFLLTRLVSLSTAGLASEADAADVEAFFAARGTASMQRTVAQSVEKIRAAAAWLRRDAADVAAWLEAQGYCDEPKAEPKAPPPQPKAVKAVPEPAPTPTAAADADATPEPDAAPEPEAKPKAKPKPRPKPKAAAAEDRGAVADADA